MIGDMRRDIQCLIILLNLPHTHITLMLMAGHLSLIHLTIEDRRESLLTVELIKLVFIIKGIGINFGGRVLYNFGSQPFFHLEFHMIPPDKI
jgi:diadenosine tetraphosphate (Ap4A) HIT family hydrolase